MYWLAKQEVAHTTKFNSLKDLTIQLGCKYVRETGESDSDIGQLLLYLLGTLLKQLQNVKSVVPPPILGVYMEGEMVDLWRHTVQLLNVFNVPAKDCACALVRITVQDS